MTGFIKLPSLKKGKVVKTTKKYTLGEKQRIFTLKISELVNFAYSKGYELTYGEAWRTPEQAKLNEMNGKGIVNSLHRDRLAVDFNLFRNGIWRKNSSDHKELGIYWESLSEDGIECCWGGRFGDGNHYSISHGGRK